jgi:hypothetical protein
MTPDQLKKTKIGLGIAAALLVIYLVTKAPATVLGSGEDPSGNGNNPGGNSIPTFNAAAIADGLEQTMSDFGTDEAEIQNLLRTVSATQFAQIVTAFGTRQYNSWTGGTAFGSLQPLKVWLKEELSTSEYNALRLKYPKSL